MPAPVHRDVLDKDISTELQRDDLVACPGTSPVLAVQPSAAVDHTRTQNGNILQVLAPDQAVMPVAVAEILVAILVAPGIWFGGIVSGVPCRLCGHDYGSLTQVKCDIAFEMYGIAQVLACREVDGSASAGSRRIDRPVDRGSIERSTVARCPVFGNVVCPGRYSLCQADSQQHNSKGRGHYCRMTTASFSDHLKSPYSMESV